LDTLVPQSGDTGRFNVTMGTSSAEGSQTVAFNDLNPAFDYTVESTVDPTRRIADGATDGLGEFLERPILIETIPWSQSTYLFSNFNPWSLFFANKRNMNRLNNFNLLRCKLCVKFVINGNGFYYGRAIASYNPLHDLDQVTVNRFGTPQDIIGCSQRPHIYINPTECQGGSMCLPFFHYQNALKVPDMQWDEMGEINLREMVALKHANGDPNAVTISVFAWAEDVQLSIPTNSNIAGLVPQGGDEYDGKISKVAAAVTVASGMLSTVPFFAPFTLATTAVAGATAVVAKSLGYSRPNVLDSAKPYRPTIMGSMATTNQDETATKLTLDCKQETTIDPRVCGLGGSDEMAFKNIVTRESFYTQFVWGVDDQPGKRLFSTYVEPTVFDVSGPTTNPRYHMLPCGFIAMPFKVWGGTMTFRFQVVSSNFHRGRLRVVWDPHDGSGDEYNVMHQTVIDVADARDVSVSVGWGNHYSFIKRNNPVTHGHFIGDGLLRPSYTLDPSEPGSLFDYTRGNGVLSVFIVNDLTVPTSDPTINSDVTINVFARMEDDFRFAQPDDAGISGTTLFDPALPTLTEDVSEEEDPVVVEPLDPVKIRDAIPKGMKLVPQSGETSAAAVDPVQESAPLIEGPPDITLGPDEESGDNEMMKVFYGEVALSIRQLVKRFQFHAAQGNNTAAADNGDRVTQPDFPFYQGLNPDGPHVSSSGAKVAYCANTWLNYFTPAFAAYRGGIRRKYLHSGSRYSNGTSVTNTGGAINMNVTRVDGLEATPYIRTTTVNPWKLDSIPGPATCPYGINDQAFCGRHFYDSTSNGTAITSCMQNNALEVELPFYTQRRFFQARRIKNLAIRNLNDENPGLHRTSVENPSGSVTSYVAGAEDFSLHFFMGVPSFFWIGGGNPNHPFPTRT